MTLPVPTQRTWTTGDIVTATEMNANVRDSVNFLLDPPVAVLVQATGQSVATSTFVKVSMDSETIDSYSGHSNVTNNSRYTAQVAGWYDIYGAVMFPSNATGRRVCGIYVNNTLDLQFELAASGSGPTTCTIEESIQLNVGDYVELGAYQSSGSSLTLQTSNPYGSLLKIRFWHG